MAAAEEKVGRIQRIGNYFDEVKAEMRKVTWPTRGELYGATFVVIISAIFLCVVLGVFDRVFGFLVENVIARR